MALTDRIYTNSYYIQRQDIKSECAATLTKLGKKDGYDDNNNNDLSKYKSLVDWMNKQQV
jgi:hypothetical protein